jgi:hypothetical protein
MTRARAGAPLEVRWKLKGPSGRVFCCRIHRRASSGFDVMTRYDGAFVRVQWVPGLDEARRLAEVWRQGILAIGGFTPMPEEGPATAPPSMSGRRQASS